MENLTAPWSIPALLEQEVIAYPLRSDLPAAWLAMEDEATFSLEAIRRPELAGSAFDLGGPELLTGDELAQRFPVHLGRTVQYYAVPVPDFEAGLRPLFGEVAAREIAAQFTWLNESGHRGLAGSEMTPVLEKLPVGLTPLHEWLRSQEVLNNQGAVADKKEMKNV